ncbi:N-methylhydantoinase B, partial [Lutimaribacter pacificus]
YMRAARSKALAPNWPTFAPPQWPNFTPPLTRYSLPAFVANALGLAVREAIRVYGHDNLHEGDIVIVNGDIVGRHLNDVVSLTPVRADGRLIGFFAVLVHWIDVGGYVVGSCYSPHTTDIWQEGVQYPTVKLYEGGVRNEELYRIIEANTRFPKLLAGDLEAQFGGTTLGRDMVLELAEQHGADAILATMDEMQADADAVARRAIEALPNGTYTASSFMDDDGIRIGEPINIGVKVIVEDDRMTIDLNGLSEQVRGPINLAKEGGAYAVGRIAFKFLAVPDAPVNEAGFNRLAIDVRDGTFLSASRGAPMGQGGYTGSTVVDTILAALSEAAPDRIPAGHYGIYGIHTISGRDPETGDYFFSLDAMSGGWGAFSWKDGPSGFRSLTHGDVRDVPVEIQEANYDYRIEAKQLKQDSGGPGRFRGGLGIEKVYSFPSDAELNLNVNIERTGCPPWGLAGGMAGKPAYGELIKPDGTRKVLRKDDLPLAHGDIFWLISGGGGGHGDPKDRDIKAVLSDLADGYISRESARNDYGVVVDDNGRLDEAATAALRTTR